MALGPVLEIAKDSLGTQVSDTNQPSLRLQPILPTASFLLSLILMFSIYRYIEMLIYSKPLKSSIGVFVKKMLKGCYNNRTHAL